MTNFDNFNRRDGGMAVHRLSEAEAGDGERNYAEHISAQKLTTTERLVVIGALVLLGFAGVSGHFTAPITDPLTTSAISASGPTSQENHHRLGHCREYSPYADKSC